MTTAAQQMPHLDRDLLVDLGGWEVLKAARGLQTGNAVLDWSWEPPVLQGTVRSGSTRFFPRLNFRHPNPKMAENACNCRQGRDGIVCPHAIALCLQVACDRERAAAAREAAAQRQVDAEAAAAARIPQSLVTAGGADGVPLQFRLLLPPNLARAAPRDAITVKLEAIAGTGPPVPPERLDRTTTYAIAEAHQALAARVETWCDGRLHGILQLAREQLREALELLAGEPAVFWSNRPGEPIAWSDGRLPGVHEHLETARVDPATTEAASTASDSIPQTEPAAPPETSGDPPSADPATPFLELDGSTRYIAARILDRTHPRAAEAEALLRAEGFRHEPSNQRWWLRDRHKALNFLATHGESLRKTPGVIEAAGFAERLSGLTVFAVRAEARAVAGGFEVELAVDLPESELDAARHAIATGRYFLERADGSILLLPPDKVERFHAAQRALGNDPAQPFAPRIRRRFEPRDLPDADETLASLGVNAQLPAVWKEQAARLKEVARLEPAPVPDELTATLRGYQRLGAAWLWRLREERLGGVLADEMGLGKTLQALALLAAEKQSGDGAHPPSLVVAPASLLENWRREAARFTPQLTTFVHHGNNRLPEADAARDYDLVITSYGTLVQDDALFSGVAFAVVVADEAQHAKNPRSRNARALRGLAAECRIALTGTPIENSLDDLRALFDFLLPGYLGSVPQRARAEERSWYDERHRRQAAPFILRRTKAVVAPELPPRIDQVVYCEMGDDQRRLYDERRQNTEREIAEMTLNGASDGRIRFAALTQLLRLRQICADPRLLDPAAPPDCSAKLAAFEELLDEALDSGGRLLVFSQFTSLLDLLADYLAERQLPSERIDGSTPRQQRQRAVDRFQQDPEIPVFLLALKAAGTGLNLTAADTVVHFDPWWNPAVEDQATGRAHRIGQTRQVTSIKLITAGTIEEKVVALQKSKAELLRDLLDESAAASARIQLDEIRELLAE